MNAVIKTKTEETKIKRGRTHKTASVSVPPETNQWLEKRLADLHPKIKGLSHYLQLLIEVDKRQNIIENIVGIRPFEQGVVALVE